jgi:hypothetical protein
MARGKYGPSSAFMLVDGYDLTAAKIKSMRHLTRAPQEDTTGLGDSWVERTPVGVRETEIVQEGAIWNTAALNSHAALVGKEPTTPQTTVRIVCMGFAGAAGEDFYGDEGAFHGEVEVVAALGELQKVNATYEVTGVGDSGEILQKLATFTADFNTESASVDHTTAARSQTITSSSVANPTVITTPEAHGIVNGEIVYIAGHSGSAPDINGDSPVATVTSATTFTIPINVTTGGTGGTVKRANSLSGGWGYQQVTAESGFSAYVGKVRHSTDDASYSDLVTFADAPTAPNAQRVAGAGTVNRYLAADGNVTGSGSITVFIGFARS